MKMIFTRFNLLLCGVCLLGATNLQAQSTTTISGTITDAKSNETLVGVNVMVKGKVIGTITDFDGNFNLKVNQAPPLTLQISIIGYKNQEVEITNASTTGVNIKMEEQVILGQEVVVSASRVEESVLKSPVSIERMDILAIQQTPADNYYKGIAFLKGVDVSSSSINFQIVNARGFNSTGNTRFVQQTDGMDTQAPALNFPIGNLNGPSELDVESLDFLPGAASALYGPNAFNGILLVKSKSPFEYQGLSAFAKVGMNHFGGDASLGEPSSPQPMFEGSLRYAKAFNNRFAFKLNLSYMRAEDWHATNYTTDREKSRQPEGFSFNPGADAPNKMGDEASIDMGYLGSVFRRAVDTNDPAYNSPALAGVRTLLNATSAQGQFDVTEFFNGVPSQVVSRTAYEEHELIDYGAENFKANASLHYRITDNVEAIWQSNFGYGTSIYSGAQRYSLSNFSIQQHKAELKSKNFFLRGYATIENSGNSYITEFLGNMMNEAGSVNNTWFATYTANYLKYLYGSTNRGNLGLPADADISIAQAEAAHNYARGVSDASRLVPGSERFNEEKEKALESGVVPIGPSFDDATKMYHFEGQYNFAEQIDFMELQVGASFRSYVLGSNGTIFPDTTGNDISIKEYGAYVQAGKQLLDERLKLTASLRFDKNQNFDPFLSPRVSGVYTVNKNHNFRIAYQTGFRNPTTQGQHINLNIISTRLLGGLPQYAEQYGIGTNTYTLESVNEFSQLVFSGADPAAAAGTLVAYDNYKPVSPEKIQSIEVGYKSIIDGKLLVDLSYYYNIYNNFEVQVRMRKASGPITDAANLSSLLAGNADNTFQIYTNADKQISSQGASMGLTYQLPRNYTFGTNYSWNVLNVGTGNEDFIFAYNTPEHKVNLTFGNRKLTDNIGFSVAGKWQNEFRWESSFADGDVPAFFTMDAQVSYKLSELKSVVKLGGSNLLNQRYITNFGGPNVGAIYYVSVTFDQLTN